MSRTVRFLLPSLAIALIVQLGGCGGGAGGSGGGGYLAGDRPPDEDVDVSNIPDAVPRPEPRSRYGNPESYTVFGKRYHVMESAQGYVERGTASWYGKKFHGRLTSNREPYDMLAMTAALWRWSSRMLRVAAPLPVWWPLIKIRSDWSAKPRNARL